MAVPVFCYRISLGGFRMVSRTNCILPSRIGLRKQVVGITLKQCQDVLGVYGYSTRGNDSSGSMKSNNHSLRHKIGSYIDWKQLLTNIVFKMVANVVGLLILSVGGFLVYRYIYLTGKFQKDYYDHSVYLASQALQQSCIVPRFILGRDSSAYVEISFVNELKQKIANLSEDCSKVYHVVVGSSKVGKTTAVCNVIRGRPNTLYIDLGETYADIISNLIKALGIEKADEDRSKNQSRTLEERFKMLERLLIDASEKAFEKTQKKPVLFLDGFNNSLTKSPDMGKSMTAFLRHLADSGLIHVFCVLSETAHATFFPDSDVQRRFMHVSPFAPPQAIQYLCRRGLPQDVAAYVVNSYSVEVGYLEKMVDSLGSDRSLEHAKALVSKEVWNCIRVLSPIMKNPQVEKVLERIVREQSLPAGEIALLLEDNPLDRTQAFFGLFEGKILNYNVITYSIELRHKYCADAIQTVSKRQKK